MKKRVYADVSEQLMRDFQMMLAKNGERMAPVIRAMVESYTYKEESSCSK